MARVKHLTALVDRFCSILPWFVRPSARHGHCRFEGVSPWLPVLAASFALLLWLRRRLAGSYVDLTALSYARVPLNAAAYSLRSLVRLRRGPPVFTPEPKEELFSYLEGPARERAELRELELCRRYRLLALRRASSARVYRDNLYVLDVLSRIDLGGLKDGRELRAVDIGSQDFRYAFALERALSRLSPKLALEGVEVDGHVVYADLRSRADYAEAYAKLTGNGGVRYRVGDFAALEHRDLDLALCFFPFVLRYALVQWGLPLSSFAPERIFERAAEALRPGGLLVVVNHTLEEHARQLEILEAIPALEVIARGDASSSLVDYADATEERRFVVARRRAGT